MARLLWVVGILAFLVGGGTVGWVLLDLPPVKLVVHHGFPLAGGPTGKEITIEGVRFIEIGTGYFRMGSWFNCTKGDALGRLCKAFGLPWGKQPQEKGNEVPVRWVEIRQPYYLADCEITNRQYERFDPEHERDWPGDDDPVTSVTWDDARAYCDWLAKRSGLPVRLPSEAEQENACRAGSTTEYAFGDDPARLGEVAWYDANSDGRAHAARTKRPNAWGLYDLHGNVWEWCEDVWHEDYRGAPEDASAWKQGASPFRVFRGVGFNLPAAACRSAFRFWRHPSYSDGALGFRPVVGDH